MAAIALNVDLDEPGGKPSEDLQQRVLEKLTKLKMNTQNLIAVDEHAAVLEHFGLFSVPAVLVFNTDGALKEKFEGDVNYERDIVPLVRQLLDN